MNAKTHEIRIEEIYPGGIRFSCKCGAHSKMRADRSIAEASAAKHLAKVNG